MINGPVLRCFIALAIPDDIRGYLCSLVERLRASGADVKWVERPNLHLTLKFLGSCSKEQVETAVAQLNILKGAYHTATASLEQLGAFPSVKRPQVVWAGLSLQDESIPQLQREIEQRMRVAGFAPEIKDFRPHVTLGRLRSLRNADVLIGRLKREPIERRGFVIDSLELMQSNLTQRGALYHTLLAISLG